MKQSSHFSALQAFTAFLIIAVAFGMLVLFRNNQEAIVESNNFQLFMAFATLGAALLLSLLYLTNKSHHKSSKKRKK